MPADPESFHEFVAARSNALLRSAWMLTGDAAAAEDLLQTALVKTWPHWSRVETGSPEAYVRKVMLRINASWRRRHWNKEIPTADLAAAEFHAEQRFPDEHGRAEERLGLMAALAALPVRQRQAVVLRYFDDHSVEEVAVAMGTSTGTVKSQSAKGLAKLRATLDSKTLERENQ